MSDRNRTGFEPDEKLALFGALERSYAAKRHVVVFGLADFCPVCPDGGGQTHEHRSDDVAAALGAWTGDPVQDTADLAYNRESRRA